MPRPAIQPPSLNTVVQPPLFVRHRSNRTCSQLQDCMPGQPNLDALANSLVEAAACGPAGLASAELFGLLQRLHGRLCGMVS